MIDILKNSAITTTLIGAYFYLIGYISDITFLTNFGLNWETFTRLTIDYILKGSLVLFFSPPLLINFFFISIIGGLFYYLIENKKLNFTKFCLLLPICLSYGLYFGLMNGEKASKDMIEAYTVGKRNPAELIAKSNKDTLKYYGFVIMQDNTKVAFYNIKDSRTYVIPLSHIERYSIEKDKLKD